MSDLSLLPALLAYFVAAASPGPATMAVSTTAMAHGARPAAMLGLGLAVGLAFWGVVAAAGLGALLIQSSVALTALRWFGGAYLLWLAWRSGQAALSPAAPNDPMPAAGEAEGRLLTRGLVLNLSNPKAVLAWVSVLALGMRPDGGGAALAATTALCAGLGLAIYLAYAAAFSRPVFRAGYRAARRGIEGLAALFLGVSGARLMLARAETP